MCGRGGHREKPKAHSFVPIREIAFAPQDADLAAASSRLHDRKRTVPDVNGGLVKFFLNSFETNLAERYGLRPVELKVLEHLVGGLTRDEIAERASLSIHTVNTHLTNAYRKLGVRNAAEAVAKISRHQFELRIPDAFC